MTLLVEEWENGPTRKRDLQKPGKIKEDHILFTVFAMLYFCLFIIWEITVAFGSFLRRLIFKPEPKSLKGKVCLVTGAGRGLGREFCLALAREGAVIACADIHESNNKTTAAMIEELGVKVVPYTVNVAIKKDVEDLVSRKEKDLGPVYLLINNAAILGGRIDTDEDFTRAALNVNLLGPIWLMNAVLPIMKLRNEGHIVNISSLTAKITSPTLSVYGSTKAALCYMTNGLRTELLLMNPNNNIAVTAILPSFINTSNDYLRFLSTRIMPTRTVANLMTLALKKVMLPNEEQYQRLPWHDLVKECSRT